MLIKLKTQKEEERDRKSRIIKRKLFRLPVFKKAQTVMFYISFAGEVNTEDMILEARRLGKKVAVPVCKGSYVALRPCLLPEGAALKKGTYGILEPAVRRYIRLRDLDLVVVPAVAFDKKGNRLGRGKGCYDHFLRKIPKETLSIGLAFDFQILPSLPITATDVSVRRVVFN